MERFSFSADTATFSCRIYPGVIDWIPTWSIKPNFGNSVLLTPSTPWKKGLGFKFATIEVSGFILKWYSVGLLLGCAENEQA